MGFLSAVVTIVDLIAPIYTLFAIFAVILYAQASKNTAKKNEKNVYDCKSPWWIKKRNGHP